MKLVQRTTANRSHTHNKSLFILIFRGAQIARSLITDLYKADSVFGLIPFLLEPEVTQF